MAAGGYRIWIKNVLVEAVGGRKTERISERDMEVLEFVARYGVVPREVVALWAGTGRAVTAARERRLREAGLIDVHPGVGGNGRLLICKRGGLRAVGREELSAPQLSIATVHHSTTAARVGVELERAGHRVLSEREIEARERAEGRRVFSAECRSGRYHRPDLVVLGDPPVAVEVELTDKSARRLEEILRAWRRALSAGQFGRVRYLCSPRALAYVERAVGRTGTGAAIDVEPLEGGDGLLGTRHRIGVASLPAQGHIRRC